MLERDDCDGCVEETVISQASIEAILLYDLNEIERKRLSCNRRTLGHVSAARKTPKPPQTEEQPLPGVALGIEVLKGTGSILNSRGS